LTFHKSSIELQGSFTLSNSLSDTFFSLNFYLNFRIQIRNNSWIDIFPKLLIASSQTARIASRQRWQSSTATPAFVKAKRQLKTEGFYKKNWLSDPATYPIFVVMGIATGLVAGVGGSCIFYNPDVQINPETRGSVLRPGEPKEFQV